MKYCIKCTTPLNDNDRFCGVCGTEQMIQRTTLNRFCTNCGGQINSSFHVCPVCGYPVTNTQSQDLIKRVTPALISSLQKRLTTSAILWFCNAGIQLLLALLVIILVAITGDRKSLDINIIIVGTLGVLNVYGATLILKTKKSIKTNYVGIVLNNRIRFTSVTTYIWNGYVIFTLLTSKNALLVLISLPIIATIIVDLVFTKLYVLRNKVNFLELEKSQIPDLFYMNKETVQNSNSNPALNQYEQKYQKSNHKKTVHKSRKTPLIAIIFTVSILSIILIRINSSITHQRELDIERPVQEMLESLEINNSEELINCYPWYYQDDIKNMLEKNNGNTKEAMNKMSNRLETQYGEEYKLSYEILDKEELDNNDLRKIMDDVQANCKKSLLISEGYLLHVRITIKTNENTASVNTNYKVIKIGSRWFFSNCLIGWD